MQNHSNLLNVGSKAQAIKSTALPEHLSCAGQCVQCLVHTVPKSQSNSARQVLFLLYRGNNRSSETLKGIFDTDLAASG